MSSPRPPGAYVHVSAPPKQYDRDTQLICVKRNEQKYIFFYRSGQERKLIGQLSRMLWSQDLEFGFRDVLAVLKKMVQLSSRKP